jgi:hypothetical protein
VARDLAAAGGDPSTVLSTSSLLTPEGVVALGASDVGRLGELTRDPEKAARLAVVLRSGNVVVAPRAALAPGPAGWWEIAPGGDARAVLDDLNASRGSSGLPPGGSNSGGGAKPMPGGGRPITVRDPGKYEDIIKEYEEQEAKEKANQGGGNEFLTLVKKVAMKVLKWAGLIELVLAWTYSDAGNQLDAVDLATDAGA